MTRRVFGGLRKRHGSWRIYYRAPDGKQVEEGTWSDRREAASVLAQRKRELADGTWARPDGAAKPAGLTVRAWATAWLERRRVVKAADEQRYFELHILPRIGDMPIADLRRSHLVELMRAVSAHSSERTGQPLAPRTVLHVYRTLATCLDDAVSDIVIPASPASLTSRRGELPRKLDADPTFRDRAVCEAVEAALASTEIPS